MITDTAAAKRMAIYHGVFDMICKTLKKVNGRAVAVTLGKDERVFYMIAAWDGFLNAFDNGWMAVVADNEAAITQHVELLKLTMDGLIISATADTPTNN